MNHFLFILLIGLISFVLGWYYLNFAIRKSIIDIPNGRSSHSIPTPRGGGIAITFSFFLGLAVSYWLGDIDKTLLFALLPGLGLSIIGLIDDYKGLSPHIRLIAQILCAIIAVLILGRIDLYENAGMAWFEYLLAIGGIVWFINVFNFMDGSNGYASMEAIMVCFAMWWFTKSYVAILLLISVVGFIYWNIPKAKLFMGDTGSTTLGYIIAILGIYLHNSESLSIIWWLFLTSLFWFDASITLLRRIIKLEAINKAHRNHIYQRAIIGGLSHMKVMVIGLITNITLIVICYFGLLEILDLKICILSAVTIHFTVFILVERKQKYIGDSFSN